MVGPERVHAAAATTLFLSEGDKWSMHADVVPHCNCLPQQSDWRPAGWLDGKMDGRMKRYQMSFCRWRTYSGRVGGHGIERLATNERRKFTLQTVTGEDFLCSILA